MRALRLFALALGSGAAIAACAGKGHPANAHLDGPAEDAGVAGAGGGFGSFGDAMPPPKPGPDAGCGYQLTDITRTPANVYFVLDRSGSMGEVVSGKKKLDAVRSAVVGMAQAIGFRVNVGAAVFPTIAGGEHYCVAGGEVLPLQPGDPKSFVENGKLGPVAQKLQQALSIAAYGDTPTAATLVALTPALTALGGKGTYVILATDGGPNCGAGPCGVDACIPNIEHDPVCPPAINCCDKAMIKGGSTDLCVDADGTLSAVSSLAAAGVTVVVVGIPGSAYYAKLLDELAVAGGAPRETSPRYHQVSDLDALESTLAAIGSDVIVTCDLTLGQAPPESNNVNVYLDDTLVYRDPKDGWTFSSATTITLHGASCAALQAGKYKSAEVFLGCATMTVPIN